MFLRFTRCERCVDIDRLLVSGYQSRLSILHVLSFLCDICCSVRLVKGSSFSSMRKQPSPALDISALWVSSRASSLHVSTLTLANHCDHCHSTSSKYRMYSTSANPMQHRRRVNGTSFTTQLPRVSTNTKVIGAGVPTSKTSLIHQYMAVLNTTGPVPNSEHSQPIQSTLAEYVQMHLLIKRQKDPFIDQFP